MANIQFFARGGIDERDKNFYFFDIDDDIIVFDIGFKLCDLSESLIGIDAVLADQSYLLANVQRIKGIFVTSSSYTKIGGLFVFLQQITTPVDIYASPFVLFVIQQKITELNIKSKPLLHELTNRGEIIIKQPLGHIKITSFELFSMTPQTMGFLIEKDAFKIVFLSELMLDIVVQQPLFQGNYNFLFTLSNQAITHLFLPASGVNNSLPSTNNYQITQFLQNNFINHIRNIFIVFHNQLFYLFEIFNYYNNFQKKVKIWIYNQHLWAMIGFWQTINKLDFPNLVFANWIDKQTMDTINNHPAMPEIIILSDEPINIFTFLQTCFTTAGDFTFTTTDDVVFASKLVFGQEWCYELFLEETLKIDFKLTTCDTEQTFMFFPSLQEIKIILNLINPQYVIPINGFYYDFLQMKSIIPNTNIAPNHLLIVDNETVLNLPLLNEPLLTNQPTNPDLITNNDLFLMNHPYQWHFEKDQPIQERKQMLSDGFISINFMLMKKTFDLATNVDIQIQGVVDSGFLIKQKINLELKKIIDKFMETVLLPRFKIDASSADETFIKETLTKPIIDYMFRVAKKSPVIFLDVGFIN